MPLFEYQCQKCGRSFERVVQANESNKSVCPSCGSDSVKKVFSPFASSRGGAGSTSCRPVG